jgi:hypothetical protein
MESLHNMQSIELYNDGIDSDGARTLANALKMNTSVTAVRL